MKKGPVVSLIGLFFVILSVVMYSGYCFVLFAPPDQTQQALCGSSFLLFPLGIILLIIGIILYFKKRGK